MVVAVVCVCVCVCMGGGGGGSGVRALTLNIDNFQHYFEILFFRKAFGLSLLFFYEKR